MKKVLCIGDSLALPGHLNTYEDTWFYKLKIEFPEYDFFSFFKRQLTTDVLVSMGGGEKGVDNWPKGADCLESYQPDIAILQLGVVDCAPRLLYKYERFLVSKLPSFVQSIYLKLIKKTRKRSLNKTIVPYNKFKKNIELYIERANKINTKIIFVAISVPDEKMIKKNEKIISNINRYNDYLFQIANQFQNIKITTPLEKEKETEVYEDGYHPNKNGHAFIVSEIKNILKNL